MDVPALTPDGFSAVGGNRMETLARDDTGWMADALCAQVDPELFFPAAGKDNEERNRQARKVCGSCEVRMQCRRWAFRTGDKFATLGALTARQRKRIMSRTGGGE